MCLIIDGQALVVALGKPANAQTFGDLADTYVCKVLKSGANYQWIDIVFDRYREETIKSTTRTRHTKSARPIRQLVEGRDVPLPKNWTNFLSLPENKADLADFLSEELCLQAPTDKEVVVGGDSEMNTKLGHQRRQLICLFLGLPMKRQIQGWCYILCIMSSILLFCLQGTLMFSCFLSPIFLVHSVKTSG